VSPVTRYVHVPALPAVLLVIFIAKAIYSQSARSCRWNFETMFRGDYLGIAKCCRSSMDPHRQLEKGKRQMEKEIKEGNGGKIYKGLGRSQVI